jgi:lactoylglutathione lyase
VAICEVSARVDADAGLGCRHGFFPAHDGAYHRSRRSRAFYEALGFRFRRDMDIVRNGELEATNYFFSIGDQENVLELTFNHDGRTYELGTAYGHVAIGVDGLDGTLAALKADHGIEPERPPYQVREGGSRICFVRDPDS